jgi:peptide deformylase
MTWATSASEGFRMHDLEHWPLAMRIYPDPVLRQIAWSVEKFDSTLREFAQEMVQLMRAHRGIGLAATQVGVLCRLIIAETTQQDPLILVNPSVVMSYPVCK